MSTKVPPQFEGHESKVEELIYYVRYAKRLFYFALSLMVLNVLLMYGLLSRKPWGSSPELCSRYCPLNMYSPTAHGTFVALSVNESITPTTTIIPRKVESNALKV
jgi:hypothetical protein